jgi:hypothetical protein
VAPIALLRATRLCLFRCALTTPMRRLCFCLATHFNNSSTSSTAAGMPALCFLQHIPPFSLSSPSVRFPPPSLMLSLLALYRLREGYVHVSVWLTQFRTSSEPMSTCGVSHTSGTSPIHIKMIWLIDDSNSTQGLTYILSQHTRYSLDAHELLANLSKVHLVCPT